MFEREREGGGGGVTEEENGHTSFHKSNFLTFRVVLNHSDDTASIHAQRALNVKKNSLKSRVLHVRRLDLRTKRRKKINTL